MLFMYNYHMDYFYIRFLKGLRQDNLKYLNLKQQSNVIASLSKRYHPKVFFCAYMPKVASTYLISVLKALTGLNHFPLFSHALQNEQNIDYDEILKISNQDYISKSMMKATENNVQILIALSIKPFLITRSITDVIVSLKDHIHRDFESNQLSFMWPQMHLNADFLTLPDDTQFDIIIDHFTPWYIDYLNSWMDAEHMFGSLLWLTYEDIVNNLEDTLSQLADYYDYSFDLTQLDQVVDQSKSDKTYFNKGVSGRGKELLSDAQLDRIKSFFRHQARLDRFIDF